MYCRGPPQISKAHGECCLATNSGRPSLRHVTVEELLALVVMAIGPFFGNVGMSRKVGKESLFAFAHNRCTLLRGIDAQVS